MPGVEGFDRLDAQPVAPMSSVEEKDVLAEGIGEDTEKKAMNILKTIEG